MQKGLSQFFESFYYNFLINTKIIDLNYYLMSENQSNNSLNSIKLSQTLPLKDSQISAKDLIKQTVAVQSKTSGVIGNFFTIASQRSYQLWLNIFGDYNYQRKNSFSNRQKSKIISYLQAKIITSSVQLSEKQKIRFSDYDPKYLSSLPDDINKLRNRIIKGRTNLDAALMSLEKIRNSKEELQIKYINQQAYQFQKTKITSLAWGLLFAAIVNSTIYRRGNTVRKTALFVTFGHLFNMISYQSNVDRYFDSVYPIFQKQALKFTTQQKEQFAGWKPQGKAIIQD